MTDFINVRDFGAKGDGVSNDTEAIRKAVAQGGKIYFPAGTYISGTIELKNGTGLHLAYGAVIRASHERSDYNADDFCPQNVVFRQEHVTGAHLITAVGARDIFIEGEGTIDGDAYYWMTEKSKTTNAYIPNPERPGQMIFFAECENVRIEGIHLKNGSYWHLFLHGCENVRIIGLRVTAEKLMATNDGIDIDCCSRVVVSDCLIDTGDDAITLRGYDTPLLKKRVCEFVTVTNCVLSSYNDNAIRVGVGPGTIRNCVFSNCVIAKSRTGICVISRFGEKSDGTEIKNIQFSNISIDARRPVNVKLTNREGQPPLKNFRKIWNIRFSNLQAESDRNINIVGAENGAIENIAFSDCSFRFSGHGPAPENDERGMWGMASTDSAFTVKRAKDIVFKNVEIFWERDSDGWENDIFIEKSENISAIQCRLPKGIRRN